MDNNLLIHDNERCIFNDVLTLNIQIRELREWDRNKPAAGIKMQSAAWLFSKVVAIARGNITGSRRRRDTDESPRLA